MPTSLFLYWIFSYCIVGPEGTFYKVKRNSLLMTVLETQQSERGDKERRKKRWFREEYILRKKGKSAEQNTTDLLQWYIKLSAIKDVTTRRTHSSQHN